MEGQGREHLLFGYAASAGSEHGDQKKLKIDSATKTSPKAASTKPKAEMLKEKRPYSKIQVIMYMTAW